MYHSSAYMALAARFPVLKNNHQHEDFRHDNHHYEELRHATHVTDLEEIGSQESVGSNALVNGQEIDSFSNDGLAWGSNPELLKKSEILHSIDEGASTVVDIEALNVSKGNLHNSIEYGCETQLLKLCLSLLIGPPILLIQIYKLYFKKIFETGQMQLH